MLTAGVAFVTAGLALLIGLPASGGYAAHVLPAGLLIAIGFGLAFPALAGIAVGSAPAQDAGVASGLFNTTQQLGGALGLAILTRVATSTAAGHTSTALDGYHRAFATAAGFAAAAFVVSLRTTAAPDASKRETLAADQDRERCGRRVTSRPGLSRKR